MGRVWLAFSKSSENQGLVAFDEKAPLQIQKHFVVCDATTGDIHTAHVVTKKPEKYRRTVDRITGPFEESTLVYLEYTTGKSPHIEKHIQTLAPDLQAKVRAACERHFG